MIIKPAKRTESVKEYYFSRKNREIAAINSRRGDDPVINLGIGAPDGRPPQDAIDALCSEAIKDGVHKYQSYVGIPELRRAYAGWYSRYYGVELNPDNQIQPLMGSKEGILTLCLAFLDKGDKVLIPDPGYPTYTSAAELCEAQVVKYDLCEHLGWQPDFDALEKMDLSGVKLMFTNYPNMPTGASATRELYGKIVDFARRHGIMVCNDNPYSFILAKERLSILAVPGAFECCVELNSLSKAHNMSGWRLGMIAGAPDVISEFLKVKSQMDSGMFRPMQIAAVKALECGEDWFSALNAEYERRKQAAARVFDRIGASYDCNSTGLFLWGRLNADNPLIAGRLNDGMSLGEAMSDRILYEAGVFITPGFIFGKNGRDFVRISLCAPVSTFERALAKIENIIS